MKEFQYQIVRYIHDKVTGEFVNVGIILFMPESKFLGSQFIRKYSRLSNFFTTIKGHHLLTTLRHIQSEITVISKRLDSNDIFEEHTSLESITKAILQEDDSSLECSTTKLGIDIEGEIALTDLFERLINKYNQDEDIEIFDDQKVWQKVYKKYFDECGLTDKFKEHSIQIDHNVIQFDKTLINGHLNCYQTLCFDLSRAESIKSKTYKWSGILSAIEKSNESISINFLTILPDKHSSMIPFIRDSLLNKRNQSLNVSLLTENDAPILVTRLKQELDHYSD